MVSSSRLNEEGRAWCVGGLHYGISETVQHRSRLIVWAAVHWARVDHRGRGTRKRPSVATAWDVLNRSENCVRNAGSPQPVLLPRCAPSACPFPIFFCLPSPHRSSTTIRHLTTQLYLFRPSATPTLLSIRTPAGSYLSIYLSTYFHASEGFTRSYVPNISE